MNVNPNGSGDQGNGAPGGVIVDIRHLSEAQLAQLGMAQIAYVRPVTVNGEAGFAIHAADGTPMAVAGDRDMAIAAILQHEMVPVTVH
ncbi:MAG TPA: DUF1150 family protein [Acetobacteraceae bacterium]